MRNRSCGHYCATHSVSRSGRRRWAVTNATRVQTGSSSHQLQFIPLHSGRLPVTPESTDGQHIVDWRPWLIGATRSASRRRCASHRDDGDRQRSFNTSDGLATISCRAADTACGIVCDVVGPAVWRSGTPTPRDWRNMLLYSSLFTRKLVAVRNKHQA